MKFGDWLIENKIASKQEISEAIEVGRSMGKKLGRVLVALDMISSQKLDELLMEFLEIKRLKKVDTFLKEKIQSIRKQEHVNGHWYYVITSEGPFVLAPDFKDSICEETEEYASEYEYLLIDESQGRIIGFYQKKLEEGKLEKAIKTQSSKAIEPYERMLFDLLTICKEKNVSDIHFNSQEQALIIKLRINGELKEFQTIEKKFQQSLLSQVKKTCGLPLTVSGCALDGGSKIRPLNLKVRSSLVPTRYGDQIVVRLIDLDRLNNAGISSIECDEIMSNEFRKSTKLNDGIVLVTGPTGSGKSWTLFSLLMELDLARKKVMTIEDPVEYESNLLTQLEVEKGRFEFSDALRAGLRQDPDVIMVGEIRDEETAHLAFEASSTGHLVFSTLHTNGAFEAITRLKNLNIGDDLIRSNIRQIFAVRLQKTLCGICSERIDVQKIQEKSLEEEFGPIMMFLAHGDTMLSRNEFGCEHCTSGLTGRRLVGEVACQNEIHEFMSSGKTSNFRSLKQAAIENALRFDGLIEPWMVSQ